MQNSVGRRNCHHSASQLFRKKEIWNQGCQASKEMGERGLGRRSILRLAQNAHKSASLWVWRRDDKVNRKSKTYKKKKKKHYGNIFSSSSDKI